MGGNGLEEANGEDKAIIDFTLSFDFTVAKTCFRNWEELLLHTKVRFLAHKLISFCKVLGKYLWKALENLEFYSLL